MLKQMKKVLSIILVLALMMSCFTGCGAKQEAYRTIAVSEANGTTNITRSEKESFDAYAGVHLLSGDDAKVKASSDMTLELDTDKHVYAEENTHFFLTADGEEGSTKTVINLDDGSVLICIDKKLGAEESFEVDTPNSTMSVRGTVFRVNVETRDGKVFTTVQTFEGAVEVVSKFVGGELTGNTYNVSAGEEILIRANAESVESRGVETVNYAGLPETTKAKLKAFGVSGVTSANGEDSQGESQIVGSDKISQAKLNESHWKLASIYRLNSGSAMELNEKGLIAKDGSENYYTLYTYNDDNVMVSAETYNAYDGEPVLVSYYKYNDDGSMAEQYSFDTKTLYFYYSDGTLKREEEYVNVSLSTYYLASEYPDEWSYFGSRDYNEHGDEVYGESYGSIYDFTNGYGMYNYSYSYEYDSDGRKLSDSVDGFAHTYEYDENKNLISVSTIREDSGARSPYDEAHYEYEFINGEYKVVYSLVYKNSEYGLYTDETTCRYDDLGQKIYEYIKTVYVDSDGNPWDDKFDYSENEYEYDEYGYKYKVNGSYAYTKFYDEKGTYNSTYTYSPETFPAEGKRGDLFTRTMTYESGDYSYSEVSVYRYVD